MIPLCSNPDYLTIISYIFLNWLLCGKPKVSENTTGNLEFVINRMQFIYFRHSNCYKITNSTITLTFQFNIHIFVGNQYVN